MKQLHRKVNIVPIIAKADTLNPDELKNLKNQILASPALHIAPALHRTSRSR